MSVEPSLVLVCDSKTGSCDADDDGGVDGLSGCRRPRSPSYNGCAPCLDDRLAEGGEVGAAHGGVLAVDEGL
jgi:hypothetical protein